MTNMHIAQKGQNAGRFVKCHAEVQPCRIKQAVHIDKEVSRIIKANYGESTLETYNAYLKDYLAGKDFIKPKPETRGRKKKTPEKPKFEKGKVLTFKSQGGLDHFLGSNGVVTKSRWETNGGTEPYSLYTLKRVSEDTKEFGNVKPYDKNVNVSAEADRLIKSMKEVDGWGLATKDMRIATSIVITPNSKVPKEKIQAVLDIIEDRNAHSYGALLVALWNNNNEEKITW